MPLNKETKQNQIGQIGLLIINCIRNHLSVFKEMINFKFTYLDSITVLDTIWLYAKNK